MKLGSDPEVFVFNTKTNQIENAEMYIQGTKEIPFVINENVSIMVDGVTLEFTTKPATCKNSFIEAVSESLFFARLELPEEHQLKFITSSKLDDRFLSDNSRIVGCDPDMNIYKGCNNEKPVIEDVFFAGGHIHIGEELESFQIQAVIKTLDKELLPYVNSLEKTFKDSFELGMRKKVQYGKKGNFRTKPYGIEYRSVSNRWLQNESTIENVFMITQDVVKKTINKTILI